MAIYIYKAKKGPIEIVEGEIDAVSRDDAVDKLSAMELVAVSVTEKAVSESASLRVSELAIGGLNPQTRKPAHPLTVIGVKTQDIDVFTLQLSSLIKAGVQV